MWETDFGRKPPLKVSAGLRSRAFVLVLHLCTACPQVVGNGTRSEREREDALAARHTAPSECVPSLAKPLRWPILAGQI
jgi:hypothetical protein